MDHTLREHIIFLEEELVRTKLELACSRTSEEQMKLELAKMSATLAKSRNITSSPPSPSRALTMCANNGAANQNTFHHINQNIRVPTAVPTANPFLRKKVHSARRTSVKKSLNPGSCSSGINLLASGGMSSSSSLHRIKRTQNTGSTLNPNSCASGLDLLIGIGRQGLQFLQGSQNSSLSLVSASNIASLLGNVTLLSEKSMSALNCSGSRSSKARLTLGNSRGEQGNDNNGNAEWNLFE